MDVEQSDMMITFIFKFTSFSIDFCSFILSKNEPHNEKTYISIFFVNTSIFLYSKARKNNKF